jgi:hypothetical protein
MTRKSLRFVKTVPTSTFLILRIFSPLRPSAAVADAELHLSFFRMRALHLQHTAKIYEKEQLPLRIGDDSCTFSLFLSHPSHGRGCCGWPNSLSLSVVLCFARKPWRPTAAAAPHRVRSVARDSRRRRTRGATLHPSAPPPGCAGTGATGSCRPRPPSCPLTTSSRKD